MTVPLDGPPRGPRAGPTPSAAHLERVDWFRALEEIHVELDVTARGLRLMELALVKVDSGAGDGVLAVPAPTGAGKSHLLGRFVRHEQLQSFDTPEGPVRPLLYVRAPSPCTSRLLAMEIYAALVGRSLPSSVKENAAWLAARQQLSGQNVRMLIIDEAHHFMVRRTEAEIDGLIQTLKNLCLPNISISIPSRSSGSQKNSLQGDTYPMHRPIGLVLSGMPEVMKFIARDGQLGRRTTTLMIEPLTRSEEDVAKMRKFLQLIEPSLSFPRTVDLSTPDMLARFHKSSYGYLGRVMAIVKHAAQLAIMQGSDRIDRVTHLSEAAANILKVANRQNPFLTPAVEECTLDINHLWNISRNA